MKSIKNLVKSLHDKKERAASGLFLVEGEVSVLEFLQSDYELRALLVTGEFLAKHGNVVGGVVANASAGPDVLHEIGADELRKLGTLASNDQAIGVFAQRERPPFAFGSDREVGTAGEIVLALSDVNDPGNLGTIIRIADWYGIRKIVASLTTVDVYNPKVISATKGSFARVDVYYEDLGEFFARVSSGSVPGISAGESVPVFGADLDGADVHAFAFPSRGILLMGSESHGIHPSLSKFITQKITIPRYGSAESLNVGIATAVILDNWKREK